MRNLNTSRCDIIPKAPRTGVSKSTRRSFLKSSAAATATLGTLAIPRSVHADTGDTTLKIGVIGCGGRGGGAAIDALHADADTKVVALGDVFLDRAQKCLANLRSHTEVGNRVVIDDDHVFSGFDAYKNVIDSGVDVVILASTPHFRPKHLAYAVKQGKHCFAEKPIAVDVPGVHSVQETCELAKQRKLSIVSGLCWRYDRGVQATMEKIADGAIGDIVSIESTFNTCTLWHRGDNSDWSRMEYQLRNWYYYTWLSGDHIVEQAVHSMDKTAWLLGDVHPLRAVGLGGRQQRTDKKYGNIFDHHTVFFEYPNNVRVYFTCRQQDNTTIHADELVLGASGQAQITTHQINGKDKWRYRGPKPNMFRVEHEKLFASIRNGDPINNGHYMCNSTLISIMGRMCTYTGKELTWEQVQGSTERLGPEIYEWSDLPEPPVAIPGFTQFS